MPIKISRGLVSLANVLVLLCGTVHGQATRSFSVADDIEMSRIILQKDLGYTPAKVSPDGRNFAVITERGLLEPNLVEDTIWIWRSDQILQFLHDANQKTPPASMELIRMASYKKGPIISGLRWLDDSSRIIFLGVSHTGNTQVFEADVSSRALKEMTPDDQDVVGFDIRNGNLAYTVKSSELLSDGQSKIKRPAFVTGKDITDLLFPPDVYPERVRDQSNYCDLWAVIDGQRFRVENVQTHQPVHLYQWGTFYDSNGVFALSPDGHTIATFNPVDSVPAEWRKYQQKPGLPPQPITPGKQDLHAFNDLRYVKGYFLIDVLTGSFKQLVNAPEGSFRGWYDFRAPRWSPDSQTLLLPNTFLPLDIADAEERRKRRQRPCVSVFALLTQRLDCLLPLKSEEEGAEDIRGGGFDPSDSNKIILQYDKRAVIFRKSGQDSWQTLDPEESKRSRTKTLVAVDIKQNLNEPPVLLAKDRVTNEAKVFWDPNPQLRDIKLGEVSVVHWKDHLGHEWEAGLVKPPDFVTGKRYPLVIQTHGFWKDSFLSYGSLPTAFAARELAAAGILVLQMPDDLKGVVSTPREAIRHVAGFESAVEKLAADGIVDPHRVGVVGFSRTCYYVMQALTASKLHFAAADITDGITYSYWGYLAAVDHGSTPDADSVIGAGPFGSGLKLWLARSPGFNLDKVHAPLLIVTQGGEGILWQWGEYSGLRYLRKPVELLDLGKENYEHVLTNPRKRLASQGSTVDWFRFWLKDEEDSDPAKAEQYAQWRHLRKLQQEQDRKSALQDPSKASSVY
jgi:dipeptidyl aminopeptidase/acylaminoacyl peptidase